MAYETARTDPKQFQDYQSAKAYTSGREKALDFLVGLFAPFVYAFIFGLFSRIIVSIHQIAPVLVSALLWSELGLSIFAIFYFWNRRKFFAYGVLAGFVLGAFFGLFLLVYALSFLGLFEDKGAFKNI